MRRDDGWGGACVCGYCRGCGGEVYFGEFGFFLGGGVYCADCVRAGREVLGENREKVDTESHLVTPDVTA